MTRKKYIILLLVGLVLGVSSCKDWDELNTDPKNPTKADAGTLLAYAQKFLSDQYNKQDVNDQPGLLLAQYWAQGPYPQISRYQFEDRNLSDKLWFDIYVYVLKNLNSARTFAEQNTGDSKAVLANKLGIIAVTEVFAWQWLVDTYGDIPYFEALGGGENPTPKYDDAETIYKDLLKRLNDAIDNFDEGVANFGDQDLIYGGVISKWKMFANSLKLRVAIRLIDSNKSDAKSAIEAAAPGAFKSNADNAVFRYKPGSINGHPHFAIVQSGRDDYAVSKTLVDVMNDLEDPRRKHYMTNIDGKFVGLEYGLAVPVGDLTPYSHVHPDLMDAVSLGILLTYSEVEFILAEAAELHGIVVGGTGEEHYNNAITGSILEYGGTDAEATAYLNNPKVSYSTAENGDKKKAIAMQKWISLYKNGFEGWNEWKRLDYPTLVVPVDRTIPVRIKYPANEQTLNEANVKAAASNIGGDKYDTKLFWDKN